MGPLSCEPMRAGRPSCNVFVVDFDGVLCDSAAETAVTAWRAGSHVWPAWGGWEPPSEYLSRFVKLRSVLETGYQAILLMRLIDTGVDDETIEVQFPQLSTQLLEGTGFSAAGLGAVFTQARNAWIERDLEDWLSRHAFYSGLIEIFAARMETDPVFVLTTKHEHFVQILLDSRGICLPVGHIYGLDVGKSKEDVLEGLSLFPQFDQARFHFVEDRLQTLIRVARRSSLGHVCLYLADWGYNTSRDRESARFLPRITIWSPSSFMNV